MLRFAAQMQYPLNIGNFVIWGLAIGRQPHVEKEREREREREIVRFAAHTALGIL